MARTTAEAVKLLVETDDTISSDLAPFIETANALVTEKCAAAVDSDGNLYHDDTRLELIERWLAAHFYAIRDNAPRTTQERAGSVGASYSSMVDLALNQTHWGQHAMILDTSGELADWNTEVTDKKKKVRATVNWGGTALDS